MPKAVEDCVKKISGTNKRTGKPYTDSEKWAICTAAHKRESKSEVDTIKVIEDVLQDYSEKLLKSGVVKTRDEANALADAHLARADFDIEKLKSML